MAVSLHRQTTKNVWLAAKEEPSNAAPNEGFDLERKASSALGFGQGSNLP